LSISGRTGVRAMTLIGDFTFTKKSDGTIDFVDRDGTYTAILYRCSK
jgi:hypothetical protein